MPQDTFPGLVVRGRDAALEALGEQLDRVRAGVGAMVPVEGVPGMGKRRLLEEAVRIAGRISFRVGIGTAEPGESVVEACLVHNPWWGALRGGAREPPRGEGCRRQQR